MTPTEMAMEIHWAGYVKSKTFQLGYLPLETKEDAWGALDEKTQKNIMLEAERFIWIMRNTEIEGVFK